MEPGSRLEPIVFPLLYRSGRNLKYLSYLRLRKTRFDPFLADEISKRSEVCRDGPLLPGMQANWAALADNDPMANTQQRHRQQWIQNG